MYRAYQAKVSQVVDHHKQLGTDGDTHDTTKQATGTLTSYERDTKDTTQQATGTLTSSERDTKDTTQQATGTLTSSKRDTKDTILEAIGTFSSSEGVKEMFTTQRAADALSILSKQKSSRDRHTMDTTQQATGTNGTDEVSDDYDDDEDDDDDGDDDNDDDDEVVLVRSNLKGKDIGGKLTAIDILFTKRVWILRYIDSEMFWEKLRGLLEECPEKGCICLVANDLVVLDENVTSSFSLSTSQWKRLSTMPTSRSLSSAVVVSEKLYVIGGQVDGKDCKVCEIFDLKSDKWSSAAPLPEPIGSPLVAVLAGRIHILPQKNELSGTSTRFFVYDPSSNYYTLRAGLHSNIHSTRGTCLVGVTDMLYLLGGEEGLSWQYSPNTDQWIQLVRPLGKYNHFLGCCAVVMDNSILLCGGKSPEGGTPWTMIEEYSTVTQQWKVTGICLPFMYNQHTSSVSSINM